MSDSSSHGTAPSAKAVELVRNLIEHGQLLINFLRDRVSVFYSNAALESLTPDQLADIGKVVEALGQHAAKLGISRFGPQSDAPEIKAIKPLVATDAVIRHRLLAETNQTVLAGVDVVSTTTHHLIAGDANYLVMTVVAAQGSEETLLTFQVTNDVARFLVQQITHGLEAQGTMGRR